MRKAGSGSPSTAEQSKQLAVKSLPNVYVRLTCRAISRRLRCRTGHTDMAANACTWTTRGWLAKSGYVIEEELAARFM